MELLEGVKIFDLKNHQDHRGTFTELFRQEWMDKSVQFKQWNTVKSEAGVLRGVHVHRKHHDYLTVLVGEVVFGLHDIRLDSPTHGGSALVTLTEKESRCLYIPPGIAHGFYFLKPSIHVYGVSEYWDVDDELGCLYSEHQLNLKWPGPKPLISARDQNLGTYEELVESYHQP